MQLELTVLCFKVKASWTLDDFTYRDICVSGWLSPQPPTSGLRILDAMLTDVWLSKSL